MKAVILAGGLGTRISEETHLKPKHMIEIGGRPILWHVMKIYSAHGIHDFVICCGYKGYLIKEYFANYFLHMSDVTFDMANNEMRVHRRHAEPWRVTLVDTGEDTMTGGRLKRVAEYVKGEDAFRSIMVQLSDNAAGGCACHPRRHAEIPRPVPDRNQASLCGKPRAPALFPGAALPRERHAGEHGHVDEVHVLDRCASGP